jgi:hypothetical protein
MIDLARMSAIWARVSAQYAITAADAAGYDSALLGYSSATLPFCWDTDWDISTETDYFRNTALFGRFRTADFAFYTNRDDDLAATHTSSELLSLATAIGADPQTRLAEAAAIDAADTLLDSLSAVAAGSQDPRYRSLVLLQLCGLALVISACALIISLTSRLSRLLARPLPSVRPIAAAAYVFIAAASIMSFIVISALGRSAAYFDGYLAVLRSASASAIAMQRAFVFGLRAVDVGTPAALTAALDAYTEASAIPDWLLSLQDVFDAARDACETSLCPRRWIFSGSVTADFSEAATAPYSEELAELLRLLAIALRITAATSGDAAGALLDNYPVVQATIWNFDAELDADDVTAAYPVMPWGTRYSTTAADIGDNSTLTTVERRDLARWTLTDARFTALFESHLNSESAFADFLLAACSGKALPISSFASGALVIQALISHLPLLLVIPTLPVCLFSSFTDLERPIPVKASLIQFREDFNRILVDIPKALPMFVLLVPGIVVIFAAAVVVSLAHHNSGFATTDVCLTSVTITELAASVARVGFLASECLADAAAASNCAGSLASAIDDLESCFTQFSAPSDTFTLWPSLVRKIDALAISFSLDGQLPFPFDDCETCSVSAAVAAIAEADGVIDACTEHFAFVSSFLQASGGEAVTSFVSLARDFVSTIELQLATAAFDADALRSAYLPIRWMVRPIVYGAELASADIMQERTILIDHYFDFAAIFCLVLVLLRVVNLSAFLLPRLRGLRKVDHSLGLFLHVMEPSAFKGSVALTKFLH